MKNLLSATLFILLPLLVDAQTSDLLQDAQSSDVLKGATEMGGSLPALLTRQLGLDQNRAEGGLGSILSLASENLDAADFDKLTGLIPGASGYIDAAKNLGAVTGPLKNLAGLNGALAKLGISPDVAAKFIPTVTDYLGKVGGGDAVNLLKKGLGTG
jgi:Protein of unknown function VcgC/VcgE (DUF2780)